MLSYGLPVLAIDDFGTIDALGRSWSLTEDVWRTFFVALIGALVMGVLSVVVELAVFWLVGAIDPALVPDAPVAEWITNVLTLTLLAPILPVLLAILYFDLRVRAGTPFAPT